MKHVKKLYAEIAKVEDQEDGTLKVWGYASSGAVDSDGETITPEAMKAALPDYLKFGAVREMHQPMAAGTAIEASVGDDGKTWFGALVVDPVAVQKVKTQVYKGFSIGGKVTARNPTNKSIIEGLNLVEVSLVDRPANPEALFTMYKAERTEEDDLDELASMLDSGTVTPAQLLTLFKASQADGTGSQVAPPQGGVHTPEPDAAQEPVTKSEDVQKGMYTLADFASLLNSIGWLAQDTAWEAEYEGDNSPLPAALAQWLKDGLGIFQAMAAEEAAELAASLTALVDSKAGTADKVGKAGAKFSADTKTALGELHKMINDCSAKMDALGYKDADDAVSAAASADTAKAATLDDTVGIPAQPNEDAVAKAVSAAIAPLQQQINDLGKANDSLKGEIETLGKRAAPGKALLKRVTIEKAQDTVTVSDPVETDTPPAEGTPARAEYEMRKVFQTGGVRLA